MQKKTLTITLAFMAIIAITTNIYAGCLECKNTQNFGKCYQQKCDAGNTSGDACCGNS